MSKPTVPIATIKTNFGSGEQNNNVHYARSINQTKPTMKIEIAKFQDGYYYVVDGVKQNKVKQEITMESFAEILCKRPNNQQSQPAPQTQQSDNQQRSGTQSGTMNIVKSQKTITFTQSGTMNLLKQMINQQNTQQQNQQNTQKSTNKLKKKSKKGF